VVVKFTLQKDAQVTDIKIISSQNDILSRGARKTLENLSGEFPRPEEALTLTVPISYSLH
jgi:protein TonB